MTIMADKQNFPDVKIKINQPRKPYYSSFFRERGQKTIWEYVFYDKEICGRQQLEVVYSNGIINFIR